MRDDFVLKTKEILAQRVSYLCSNPGCKKHTCGPNKVPNKIVNIGVAAHITGASMRGPRFNEKLTKDERKSIENGIWLCQNCAKMIDADVNNYNVEKLKYWKKEAELFAQERLGESYDTFYNWKDSLSEQLTTFSRVEFEFPFFKIPDNTKDQDILIQEITRMLYRMICNSFIDLQRSTHISSLIFGLSLEFEEKENHICFYGELFSHLTPFAYNFGEFVNVLKSEGIDGLFSRFEKYPDIRIKRHLKLGKFQPFKVSRVNPTILFVEHIGVNVLELKGDITTSDLIRYFSAGANAKLVWFDDQNKKRQIKKHLRLMNETMDGFDLSEIWINPNDPEDWSFN